MRLRGGRRRRPVVRAPSLPIIILLLLCLCFYMSRRLEPVFWSLAEMELRSRSSEIIAGAVRDYIAREPVVVEIEKDERGRVSLVKPNIRMINALSSGAQLAVQQEIRALEGGYVEIPMGLLMGSYFFAGSGPRLKARILPVGSASVGIEEQFQSLGYNQARHVVYLRFGMTVRLLTLFASRDISVDATYPVSEVIFTGEVPQFIRYP
jgi:sporulation protein YunB